MKPLKINKLRTAGLASVKSAMFGLVRKNADGTARPHQGIDLQANKGDEVFAVDNGTITNVTYGTSGYGYTITLKINPTLYAFYAHLSDIMVNVGDSVTKGQLIAKTGDTGNAKGMSTIAKGGHLHFELRNKLNVGLGLGGRIDPLTHVELDND